MDSNLIVLTDQDGNSVRFELLDIVEYKEDEYAVLYPADGGDDEPVHILRIISENLDVNEAEFEGLDDDELIDTIYQIFRERNDLDKPGPQAQVKPYADNTDHSRNTPDKIVYCSVD